MVNPIVAISYLPQLEPLLGAAFGVNIAYFNLERFRYRRIVREEARRQFQALREKETFHLIANLEQTKKIQSLATIRDNDPMGESDTEYNSHSIPALNPDEAKIFRGRWFRWCFSLHQDTHLSKVLTWLMAMLLFLCVNHSIGMMAWTSAPFDEPDEIFNWSLVAFGALAIPLMSIFAGNRMVSKLRKNSESAFKEMGELTDNALSTDVDAIISKLNSLPQPDRDRVMQAVPPPVGTSAGKRRNPKISQT